MPEQPKPRVLLTDPPQFMCGWCGEWDVQENLRTSPLVGNAWPIHNKCYVAWYDGEKAPSMNAGAAL